MLQICYYTTVIADLLLYICYHISFRVQIVDLYLNPFQSVLIDRFYLAPAHFSVYK